MCRECDERVRSGRARPIWLIAIIALAFPSGNAGGNQSKRGDPEKPERIAPRTPSGARLRCPPGMALLDGGAYRMEDVDGQVKLEPFCIDEDLVTSAAYRRCEAPGCTPPDKGMNCNWGDDTKANHPINCVDFNQAEAYCKAQGKQLPTEEQWEWAARGGARGTKFPWGDEPPTNQLCWNGPGNDRGFRQRAGTCPVGAFPKGDSPQGVHDLSGNIWEWTRSRWEVKPDYYIVRGGTWTSLYDDAVRAGMRYRYTPEARTNNMGFRCVSPPRR